MERRCWVNFQCWGVLLVWMIVGQGPIALAVGAGGGCLDIFSLIYLFSFLSPSLWETARYRLKYCLKGPLNPKQPTRGSVTRKGWFSTSQYNYSCILRPHSPVTDSLFLARRRIIPLKVKQYSGFTVKILKIRTPEIITVIVLQLEELDFTV